MRTPTKIKRIRELENDARRLQSKMDKIDNEWHSLLAEVRNTREWQADCAARGLVIDPQFRELFC